MNKITANQTQDLMEAYNSIYEDTDLTEEQIIEDFNLWIDNLLDEGYDLSDYTEDELYEYYITEGWANVGKFLKKAGEAAWKGKTVTTKKGSKFVPGAEQAFHGGSATAARLGLKFGVPLAGLAALDQMVTGGAGREWTGAALQALGKAGRSIPRPGEVSGTAKPTPSEKEKPRSLKILGGKIVGYNENYNPYDPTLIEDKSSVIAPLNGRLGFIVTKDGKKEWMPIDTKKVDPKVLDQWTSRYSKERGVDQINRDMQASNKAKAEQEARRQQAAQRPSGATKPAPSAATPVAPAGSPAAARPTPGAPASRPAQTAAPAASRPVSGAPATTQASPANMSTADKIKSGMGVWGQQMKMGDTKGAADTGMGVWRMANPKLAAAADERARIRGTAQTDNPLMRGFRSRLPLTPSVQSPDFQKTMAGSSGNQSLVSNPNTAIAATPRSGAAANRIRQTVIPQNPVKAQPSAQRSAIQQSPIKTQGPMNKIQASPMRTAAQNTLNKTQPSAPQRSVLRQSYEQDAYDIILEYLIDRGHADTLDEANYLMLEMDETAIQSILEEYKTYSLSVQISEWVDSLLDEGHDLSEYQWEDLVEYYLNEMY